MLWPIESSYLIDNFTFHVYYALYIVKFLKRFPLQRARYSSSKYTWTRTDTIQCHTPRECVPHAPTTLPPKHQKTTFYNLAIASEATPTSKPPIHTLIRPKPHLARPTVLSPKQPKLTPFNSMTIFWTRRFDTQALRPTHKPIGNYKAAKTDDGSDIQGDAPKREATMTPPTLARVKPKLSFNSVALDHHFLASPLPLSPVDVTGKV
jgi:hypothetical protein